MNVDFSYMTLPQYVYMTKNRSSKNTLELIITNYSSEPVVIENPNGLTPDDYPEYDDLPKEGDPAGFYIYFHYGSCSGDLTEKEDGADILVDVSAAGWDVSWGMESETVGAYWIIAPQKTIAIAPHDSISVEISNIRCNGIVGETPIHIEYRANGETLSKQVNIYKMFHLNYDLSCKAMSEYITADHKESFKVMITNNASSPLKFQNSSGLEPDDYPAYDEYGKESQAAGFYLYFHYGDQDGDIVTKEESVNYTVNVMEQSGWRVGYGESPTIGRYFKVCPVETSVMESHQSLILYIENLNINQKAGLTPLYIELRAEGKILPIRLDFMKVYKPVIQSFGPVKEGYDINDIVTFQWDVENRDGCSLTISNSDGTADVTIYDKYDMKMTDSTITLTAKNRAGYPVSMAYTPAFTFITCFQAIDCDGEYVTLKWETRNGSKCRIEGVGEVELSGTKAVPAKQGSAERFSFKLILTQKESFFEHEQILEFGYAKITQFNRSGRYYRPLSGFSMKLSEENPFVTPEEIERLPAVPIVTLPYDGGWHPKSWHNGLEWNGQDVESYELVGYARYNSGGSHWEYFGDCQSRNYTLRAYSLGGKAYDEKSI